MNFKKKQIYTNGLKVKWLGLSLSIISFVIFLWLFFVKCDGIYYYVYVLPLMFSIINIIFIQIYNSITIISIIVIGMEFIRFAISPAIVCVERFPKGLYFISFSKGNMMFATVLLVYELISIYIALYVTRKESLVNIDSYQLSQKLKNINNYGKLGISTILIIIFTFLLFLKFPQLFKMYSFIFDDGVGGFNDISTNTLKELPSGIGWLGSAMAIVTEYSIIQFLLVKWYDKFRNLNKFRYVMISIILVLCSMLFVSSSVVISLIFSIVLLIEVYILYPNYRKLFIFSGVVLGSLAFAALIKVYLKNVLLYQTISQMIQDYTNGFYSVYQGAAAYKKFNQPLIDKIAMFFLGDGIANISPFNVFFNFVNSSDIYNNYIYARSFNGGAVLPYVSQCSYYFSSIVGPALSFLPVYFSRRFEKKWRNCEGNILLNGFMAIVFALTPFMYNVSTLIHIITMFYLPMWFGIKMNRKFVFGKIGRV